MPELQEVYRHPNRVLVELTGGTAAAAQLSALVGDLCSFPTLLTFFDNIQVKFL